MSSGGHSDGIIVRVHVSPLMGVFLPQRASPLEIPKGLADRPWSKPSPMTSRAGYMPQNHSEGKGRAARYPQTNLFSLRRATLPSLAQKCRRGRWWSGKRPCRHCVRAAQSLPAESTCV